MRSAGSACPGCPRRGNVSYTLRLRITRTTATRPAVTDSKCILQPPNPGSCVMKIGGSKSRTDEDVFNTAHTSKPFRWENGYAVINPGANDESVICAIQFDPGRTVSGKV